LHLPKIEKINWIHNKEYLKEQQHEFLEKFKRLEIFFTHQMEKESINHKTLNITLLSFLFFEKQGKYTEIILEKKDVQFNFIMKEDKKIVFVPFLENLRLSSNPISIFTSIPPHTSENPSAGYRIIIRLKGDFIYSENGQCLDGNHLKGVLPSGNGCEGGIFESWFDIKYLS